MSVESKSVSASRRASTLSKEGGVSVGYSSIWLKCAHIFCLLRRMGGRAAGGEKKEGGDGTGGVYKEGKERKEKEGPKREVGFEKR